MQRFIPILLIIIAFAGFGCRKKEKVASTPVAQVSDDILSEDGFKSLFSEEDWAAMTPQQRKKHSENWVNLTLLAQAADEQGLGKDPAVRQRIDLAVKKVKANALIARKLAGLEVSEDELFNYYRVHQGDFKSMMPEYNIQRVFVKSKAAADDVVARVKGGLDFNEAVLSFSVEALKNNLGNMGFVSGTGPDSLFWQKARVLREKELAVLEVPDGAYVFRQTGSREGSQPAGFEEYRGEIRERILKERRQQVYENLLRELKMRNNEIYYY